MVTETYAYEVEWMKKYKEAPGQALLYAALLRKKPGIILLSRNNPLDRIYYLRSVIICQQADILLEVIDTDDPDNVKNYTEVLRRMWY